MAQQTTVRFVDDLDGSDAVGTIEFGLDGRTYQIDLSDGNAATLRDALAPFIDAARQVGGRGRGRARRQPKAIKPPAPVEESAAVEPRAQSTRAEAATIREWAREHGLKVNDRGRISRSVLEAYRAAG